MAQDNVAGSLDSAVDMYSANDERFSTHDENSDRMSRRGFFGSVARAATAALVAPTVIAGLTSISGCGPEKSPYAHTPLPLSPGRILTDEEFEAIVSGRKYTDTKKDNSFGNRERPIESNTLDEESGTNILIKESEDVYRLENLLVYEVDLEGAQKLFYEKNWDHIDELSGSGAREIAEYRGTLSQIVENPNSDIRTKIIDMQNSYENSKHLMTQELMGPEAKDLIESGISGTELNRQLQTYGEKITVNMLIEYFNQLIKLFKE